MKRKPLLLIVLGLVVLSGFGCSRDQGQNKPSEEINREDILFEAKKNGLIMDEQAIKTMTDSTYLQPDAGTQPKNLDSYLLKKTDGWKSAALADVTGGGSFGLAFTQLDKSGFTLIAKMGNLPIPQEGFFYEGWIVRRGDTMSVVSTGKVQQVGEQTVNVFLSPTDFSDHDFYVLTLEPDDGDPAPAEHILEGTIK